MAECHAKITYGKMMCFLGAVDILLNILARIPKVCDTYTDHIFRIWLETYGRLTALVPFSVGEIMLIFAIAVILGWLISGLCFLFWRKRPRFRRYMKGYSKGLLALILVVVLIMTLNCSMLYGCSPFNVKGNRQKSYSAAEVRALWNYVAAQCNHLALQIERDETGTPVCPANPNQAVRTAMQKLSASYPRLQGVYPDPKPIHFSQIMYQADCTGVYFPFSLEANYNTYLSDLGYPATAAHELSHLKGYIFEDEADFIAYLACTRSDEPYIRYSGYLSVLGYLQSDYLEFCQVETGDVTVLAQVYEDAAEYYFTEETCEEIESMNTVFEKETVETVSDGITDTYMKYYNAEPNYKEVTRLLLAYYDGIL